MNCAKKIYSLMTIIGINVRTYVNIANGIEPNKTSVIDGSRFNYLQEQLQNDA